MRIKATAVALVTVAALVTGAAIVAPAQKRAARKSAASAAPTPAPAKPDARAAEEAKMPAVPAPSPAPAKKNAGQRAEDAPPAAPAAAAPADDTRYTYEFSQPDFVVSRMLIEHDSAGHARMTFERRGDGAPITEPFEISPAVFARIVAAWEALRFLDTQAGYQSDKQFPHLGTVRLGLRRGGRERTTEFNWTGDERAAALAREYRRLGDQQLFVFDVEVARQYQPSETVKLLKRLESLLERNDVSDAGLLAPLLTDLSTDERIPLMARNQAGRLLKKIQKK